MSEVFYNAKNLIVSNGFIRNPNRYYLEEFFNQLPCSNNNIVTQATNHTTTTELNAPDGIITLAAVALNATTNAEFTFTNSFIKSTSLILLTMQDENTTDNVQLSCAVHTITNGNCKITLVNSHSSGNTSTTASKIHFKILDSESNKHFEVGGASSNASNVTFSSTEGGIQLQTNATDDDQVIVLPHLGQSKTAWSGIKWGTENQVEWECAIRTGASIADTSFWAGLKSSNVPTYATNDDQAYFLYASDASQGVLTTNANLHFIYSVGDTDYITDLGIAVAAAATSGNVGIYKLRIVIDNNRQVAVYVNGVQYGLVTTSTAGGATQSTKTTLSNALTNDINLIPYVGVQTLDSSNTSKQITLCYEKISRLLFE